jgi:MarR family transcriptional regulator, organic hydroperoxide resistance regulator
MRKTQGELRAEQVRQLSLGMKRLVTGVRTLLEDALAEEGITLAQLRMLASLRDQPEISAAELARALFITPQSMQAIVTRAEQAGWIVRQPSPANRRILTATLTAKGRRVLERGSALYEVMAGEIWGSASVADLKSMNATLAGAIARLQPKLDALHETGTELRQCVAATRADAP